MFQPGPHLRAAFCGCALLTAACAPRTAAPIVSAPATAPIVPAVASPDIAPRDVVADAMAASSDFFAVGQRELALGHLTSATRAFNEALAVLLRLPEGARADNRARIRFDRLVEQISALELAALVRGDGFTERPTEPASIDEILALSTLAPAEVTQLTADAVATAFERDDHDIPIPLNSRVLGYVELYRSRLKTSIEAGLSRGSQYLPMIQDVFREEGIPLDLAYIPLVESAFKSDALSRASARGMWQFMRATAVENGLRYDWFVDERADPEKSTRAAARYLKSLYESFGDWHLALASYNGGPGRVHRALAASGADDFWELVEGGRYLPRETRNYVPLILAAMIIAKTPAEYGLDIEPAPVIESERIALTAPADLRHVAEWTGTTLEVVQKLNPELRRWTTPLQDASYQLVIPRGTAGVVAERMASLPLAYLARLNWYTVQRGDTLGAIARDAAVRTQDLADANGISLRSILRIGQQLLVPSPPTLLLAASTDTTPPTVASATVTDGAPTELAYRVRPGDTLYDLARQFRTTVTALRAWNHLSGNIIRVGDRLTIFEGRTTATD